MQKTYHIATRPVVEAEASSLLTRLLLSLADADRRYRERRAIARLTDGQLNDAGLTREEAGAL